jgi:hypothetical protein
MSIDGLKAVPFKGRARDDKSGIWFSSLEFVPGWGDGALSTLFCALHPHDPCGEKDTGDHERQKRMRLIAIVERHRGINPPNHRTHEPDKGKIPHSHRGYLNNTSSQCDNLLIFHYFGNLT